MPTHFGLIVIGDEILNGHRRDRHMAGIGTLLREHGFQLAWVRFLADDPDYLVAELQRTMAEGIPVFSCGGIGATPDDYTRACAARAAGVPVARHPGALALIEERFGAEAHPHRVRMADIPQGSELIPNPYNRIPGFSIREHYFMPGFPDMAHPMAQWVLETHYAGQGAPERQMAVRAVGVTETALMDLMQELEGRFPGAKLFSLPRLGSTLTVELGFRGRGAVEQAYAAMCEGLDELGVEYAALDE